MKIGICLGLFILIYSCTYSQDFDMNYQQHGDYMDVYDNTAHKIEVNGHSSLSGTPLLSPDWAMGSVIFRNGKQVSNLPLRFNLQNNTLYFKKDSSIFAFADKVLAFKMAYNDEGINREVLFKSGYPDHHGNSTNLLYEVINNGPNVHFLKLLRSNLEQQYVYGLPAKEYYAISAEPYLYDVKRNRLIKISENEKSILKALPDYKEQVQKFAADNNSKLDNTKDIDQLITSLNYVK